MLIKVLALLPILVFVCTSEPIKRSDLLTSNTVGRPQEAQRYFCDMDLEALSAKLGPHPTYNLTLRSLADEIDQNGAQTSKTAAESPTRDTRPYLSSRIPDVRVYNQDGKPRNFYSDIIKGNTVAINFIFTTCTTICPQLTATFRRVQQNLPKSALRVQLISISVDPATDTPERLHEFAAKFKAGPGWTFVTGGKSEIDSLLQALGAGVGAKNDHTSIILIGNDITGNWTRTSGLSSPAAIEKLIEQVSSRK
jgi:cytochrome oxidase Cu insertion factor (SCO1/SenC/PrrC family)